MPHRKTSRDRLLLVVGLLSALVVVHALTAQPGAPNGPTPVVIATSKPVNPPSEAPVPPPAAPGLLPLPPSAVPDDGLLPPITPVRQVNYNVDADTVPTRGPQPAIVAVQGSALSVEVHGPDHAAAAEMIPYEIRVRNLGQMIVAGVRLENRLVDGAKLVSADPTPDRQGDRLSWNLGEIEGSGVRRIRFVLQPGPRSELTLSPTVTFTAPGSLCTKVKQDPLVLTQSAPAQARCGETLVIHLQVANRGTTPLNHVMLRDDLPPGLAHKEGKRIQTDLGTLAPGDTRTIRLDLVAMQAGSIVHEVSAAADGCTPVRSRAEVQVTTAGLDIRVEACNRRGVGQDLDYAIELTNKSAVPVSNVRLTQMVPDGFELIATSQGGAFDSLTRSVAWSFGVMQPGQRLMFALKARAKLAGEWKWESLLSADRTPERVAVHTMTVGER